jgi:cellulose synthase/poly-beta-1,6-N-acetylglucosamine synthase-like glycosyltransferase
LCTSALLVLLAGVWIFLGHRGVLAEGPSTRLFLVASAIGCLDVYDLLMRLYFRWRHTRLPGEGGVSATSMPLEVGEFTPYQVRKHIKPWALLVSVYNAEAELDDFLEAMAPYRDNLWVIDDASTDDTALRLEQAGVRCLRSPKNRKKPGALKALVAALDPRIVTVVVLDPDSRILDSGAGGLSDLERVIFEFQRSRAAALSPRVAVRDEGLLTRLQELEYAMSFSLGRKSLRDRSITSGIAVYRRDALARALERHTLSVYAEDLKNAFLLLAAGESIYYDGRLVVETEGKKTVGGWFSQRVGWYFGLIKVYAEDFADLARAAKGSLFFTYHFLLYTGVFALLLHPLKLLCLGLLTTSLLGGLDGLLGLGLVPGIGATEPIYFLLAYVQYTGFALVALFAAVERGGRLRLLPAVPVYFFYSVLHTVPITVGYLNWFTLRLLGRRLYSDHFQEDLTLRKELYHGAR